MSTIKEQVLKEFTDAKCIKIKGDMFLVKSEKGNGISKFTEEDAWLDFKSKYCKPLPYLSMNYKELILEKFPDAQVWEDSNFLKFIESGIISESKNTDNEAWESFYNMYCTDKPDLIIGEEYEFSLDESIWYKKRFAGYSDSEGQLYEYVRPIQNNLKLDQLKQLADELGYNLTKQ